MTVRHSGAAVFGGGRPVPSRSSELLCGGRGTDRGCVVANAGRGRGCLFFLFGATRVVSKYDVDAQRKKEAERAWRRRSDKAGKKSPDQNRRRNKEDTRLASKSSSMQVTRSKRDNKNKRR